MALLENFQFERPGHAMRCSGRAHRTVWWGKLNLLDWLNGCFRKWWYPLLMTVYNGKSENTNGWIWGYPHRLETSISRYVQIYDHMHLGTSLAELPPNQVLMYGPSPSILRERWHHWNRGFHSVFRYALLQLPTFSKFAWTPGCPRNISIGLMWQWCCLNQSRLFASALEGLKLWVWDLLSTSSSTCYFHWDFRGLPLRSLEVLDLLHLVSASTPGRRGAAIRRIFRIRRRKLLVFAYEDEHDEHDDWIVTSNQI